MPDIDMRMYHVKKREYYLSEYTYSLSNLLPPISQVSSQDTHTHKFLQLVQVITQFINHSDTKKRICSFWKIDGLGTNKDIQLYV